MQFFSDKEMLEYCERLKKCIYKTVEVKVGSKKQKIEVCRVSDEIRDQILESVEYYKNLVNGVQSTG